MTQKTAIEAVKTMPDDFNVDELVERLIFIEKVEEGLKDIKEGRTISHTEMLKKIEEWRK